jgi:hypothetical protein
MPANEIKVHAEPHDLPDTPGTTDRAPRPPALAPLPRLVIAQRLTTAIMPLAAVAAGVGLLVPSVYRDTAWVVPQNRGQDLVTLFVVAVLVPVLTAARAGSPRAVLVWLGLLGYVAYTYTGAAFAYAFNVLFLVYVGLFSLTGAALVAGLSGIDVAALSRAFDAGTPRRGVTAFLLVVAAMLCVLWFSQIVPFLTAGELPSMIARADTPTVFVYVLDLGIVVPLALVSAWWLRSDRPWGDVLAGFVLVKAATMGLALVSMTGFAWQAGLAVDVSLSGAWIALAAGGSAMSIWFFSHCRGSA